MKKTIAVLALTLVVFGQAFAQVSTDRAPDSPPVVQGEVSAFDDPPFAYGFNLQSYSFQAIPDNTFSGVNNLFSYSNSLGLFAGDMGPDGRYFAADYNSASLYEVDFSGNTLVYVAPITGITPGETITGMTYHRPSGTMYFSTTSISASTLYSINLETGVLSPIGQITNCPAAIDLAINEAGRLFTVDILNDNFVEINPATGAGTIVGPLGFGANFAQSMDFDDNTGELYWAAYGAAGQIRIIDTSTGGSVVVAASWPEYGGLSIYSDPEPPAVPIGYLAILVFVLLTGGFVWWRFRRLGARA
jgi:hypothetical protein